MKSFKSSAKKSTFESLREYRLYEQQEKNRRQANSLMNSGEYNILHPFLNDDLTFNRFDMKRLHQTRTLSNPCNFRECKQIKTYLKSVPPLIEKNGFYEKLLVFNYSLLIFSTHAKFLPLSYYLIR